MSWQLDNALKRIYNTFKRVPKQIYKEDINALKTLKEALDFYKADHVNDNKLFSKVLLLLIKERYFKYNDVNQALESIKYELGFSINYQLEILTANIRNNELCAYINTLEILVTYTDEDTVEQWAERENDFFNEHQAKIIKKISDLWSSKYVTDCFYNSANEFINDVNNYN